MFANKATTLLFSMLMAGSAVVPTWAAKGTHVTVLFLVLDE
jgi:hypothetical protein